MATLNAQTINRLKGQLLTSGLQQKDQALYQVINQLIDALSGVGQIVGAFLGTGGSGGGGSLAGASFITVNDETATLPNSKQLVAGDNITLVPNGNTLVINSTAESITNIFNNFSTLISQIVVTTEISLTRGRKNGKSIVRGTFTKNQVGAPVMIVQVPDQNSELGIIQFSGEVLDTKRMRVFWQSPFGAPTKTRITYLIGAV